MTSHQIRFGRGRGLPELVADRWEASRGAAADGADRTAHGSVLLLHGGGQARGSWTRSAHALAARGWHTYALDLRGHGDSGWADDGDYSIDAFVDDVVSVAGTLSGQDPHGRHPVLVGASLGGWISLLAEGERGDVARALVLVDITHRTERAGVDRIRDFMNAHRGGFASLHEVADALHAYQPDRPRTDDPDRLRRNVRLREDGRWYWHWDPAFMGPPAGRGPEVTPERLAHAARQVSVPSLLVRGRHSDVVSAEAVREMQQLLPGARAVDVADAGHMVVGDDNDVFTQALGGLLEELESARRVR